MPRHFALADLAAIGSFVDAAGTADLVTFDGTRPVATLLPVIWDRPAPPPAPAGSAASGGTANGAAANGAAANGAAGDEDEDGQELGRLLGHIALANDQWRTAQPGAQALAIVRGPQAYISPSWYASKAEHGRVVPTWNYEAVHLTGELTVHRDPEWLRDIVTRLTRKYEGGRDRPWHVTDAPPDYVSGQLRGIVGVEMAIASVEAKRKLSQNRGVADQAGTVRGLRGEPGPGPAAIADQMDAALAGRED